MSLRLPIALAVSLLAGTMVPPAAKAQPIKNPYYSAPAWKLWYQDQAPVTSGAVTLTPPATADRRYPDDIDPLHPEKFLVVRTADYAGRKYAGYWDDVYFSVDQNSGSPTPHSWMPSTWSGADGNSVNLARAFMTGYDIVNQDPGIKTFGINFTSQSTTMMGSNIANQAGLGDYAVGGIEKNWYFANCLRAGPATTDSYIDNRLTTMFDTYKALAPCYYNSCGQSSSEVRALTKMLIAGGFLPIATKQELKRNGAYIAALLYLWKAALPFEVPYDNELRHRVAYASSGDTVAYLLNRPFHLYDDTAHLRNMVTMAKGMTVAPPMAILSKRSVSGGTETYFYKTTALIQQPAGQSVQIRVSTAESYDLQGLPLTFRWKLLYGNPATTIVQEDASTYLITVPWDAALPKGRTTILLVANNGVYDSNPAAVNVYRDTGANNSRPTLSGLEDRTILPGETVTYTISSSDPDGFPTALYRRSGEVGTLTGGTLSWASPATSPDGTYPMAVISADGTTGYNSAQATVTVSSTLAKTTATPAFGPAPLQVTFSSAGSRDKNGNALTYRWDFGDGGTSTEAHPVHGYASPGFYRAKLTVTGPFGSHSATVQVHARHSWPLHIDNGWTTSLDTSVWRLANPANGSVAIRNGSLVTTATQNPFALESVETFPNGLYFEAEFKKDWITNGDSFAAFGNWMGWTYNGSTPMLYRNPVANQNITIGQYLANPVTEKGRLRVYVTGDPENPGKTRYAGFLDALLGSFFFEAKNQDVTSNLVSLVTAGFAFEIVRYQLWAPQAYGPSFVSISPETPFTMVVGQSQRFAVVATASAGTLSYSWQLNGASVGGNSADHDLIPTAVGALSLSVTVSDGSGQSIRHAWTIAVTEANHAPVAESQWVTTDQGRSLALTLRGNDPDGDVLTWAVNSPAHGALSGSAPNLTYSPAAGFAGTDAFTFRVNDSRVSSNAGTVTVQVLPLPVDAGMPPDAASAGRDAASAGPDAAAPGLDAATAGADAATAGPDAATAADASVEALDAASAADAASSDDAASAEDAMTAMDSGEAVDAKAIDASSGPDVEIGPGPSDAALVSDAAAPEMPLEIVRSGCGCSAGVEGTGLLGLVIALLSLRVRRCNGCHH
ncbi:MAG: PKD domain-containing protein [Deltaproteobacteria bacterium]|nr:PKD domain-containing protein [Deltaproteobacteria bacterium]